MTDVNDANEWLMSGASVPAAKFEEVGNHVVGHIAYKPEIRQSRDFETKQPAFWRDGKPKMEMKVILQTEQRDPSDPDDIGERAIYIRGQMQKAVAQACAKVGAKGLAEGGKLLVRLVGRGEPPQKGMDRPKLFEAQYRPPTETVPVPQEPVAAQVGTSNGGQQQPSEQPAAPLPPIPF